MKKSNLTFSLSLLLALLISCNEKESLVKKDVSLNKTELIFEVQDDSIKTISVESSGIFYLDNQAEWLNLHVDQDNKTIEASVEPNPTRQIREAFVKVFDEESESRLHIKQLGVEEEKEPYLFNYLHTSGVSSFFTSEEDGRTVYHFKASNLFVNQDIKNEIFLGNILNPKLSSFNTLQTYKDYIFNNVTILADVIIDGKLYIEEWETPTKLQMDNLAQKIIDATPKQNQSFSTGSPVVYRSYKYLHYLSMANLGFGIDTVIHENASSYKEMKKDIGLIYSYNQSLFTLFLDFSSSHEGQREETDFITKNNLSYISSVAYGKAAFLIVEANGSKTEVNSLINKVLLKKTLSEAEKSFIDEMEIYHLNFSQNGTLQNDNSTDNIEKIRNYSQIGENNIIPLNFTVADYVYNGMEEIEYSIKME